MALLLPFPPPIRNFFSHSSCWRGGALRRGTTLNLLAPSLPSPFPDLHSLIDQHFCAKGALICLVIDALVEATLSRTILEEGRWNLLELDFDPSLEKMSSPLASPNNSSSSSNPSSTSPPPPSSPAASSPTSDPSPPPTSPSFSKSSSPLLLGLHNKFRLGTLPLPPPGSSSSSPVLPSPTSSAFTTSHYEAEKSAPLTTISPPSIEGHRSGLNLTMVIGVATGIGLFFVLVIIICICCKRKQTKNRHHNPMQYYNDASVYKDSGFYSTEPPPKWHNDEHVVKVPPTPGGGWHPPRAPSIMNTDDMGSGFTGPKGPLMPPPSPAIALGLNTSTFTYEELSCATNGFSHANLLGQGGFGFVYKGVLPNGKDIAVKQLKSGSGQGEREFHAEVDIISRVRHRHLVFLVGYCICGSHRILVYEYVPNNTLEYHLHGKGLPVMDWSRRLKIALGSGRGIAYLHEDCNPRIIHRDIKSANILLDLKFEAMVADFGLAKLSSDNHTHVSTRVMGTFGYLAPEYASSGKLTQKSDVFSYGVMLLEIITGRRPVDSHAFMEDSLVDWARPLLSRALADGDYDEIADRRLNGNYDPVEMARMVACAAACVRHSAKKRPKMSQIVKALEGVVSLEELNEGMRPGQSMMFSSGSEYESSSYTSSMNRLRKVMLPSPEFTGEYSGTIPEYDPRHSGSSDDAFSSELSPVENQRHKARSPL